MARLIVKTGEGSETVELTTGSAVRIGRDPSNEIPLPQERQASRHHCRIAAVQTAGQVSWEVSDLGATNKTRVNGKPTERQVLASGDVVQVGRVEITFEDPDEEAHLKEAGTKGVCYLEWILGDRKGEKIWLEATRTTLGRRTSNTIPLDDRMSSGHHAEITRDLNGYTIRDLGSTNGTLVNGEPTTEAALTHGTRVRIGNSRFVFKDPSMKDVEIELSQLEEDEGWGMMGDIDLSRARGSYVGLLVGVLLLLAAAAGGVFLFQQAESERDTAEGGGAANLVQNGDMEDAEALPFLWAARGEDEPVSVGTTTRGAGLALSLRHTGGDEKPAPVVVSYADDFPVRGDAPLRIQAYFRKRGSGDAALVAVWRNKPDAASGATGLTHTLPLGQGSVDVVASKPIWAESVSLGVRLEPGGRAELDDVVVTRATGGAASALEIACPGDAKAWVHPSGGLDMMNSLTVLVAGAAPVARLEDGTVLHGFEPSAPPGGDPTGPITIEGVLRQGEREMPASIRWSRTAADDGLIAEVRCSGAASVGLDAMLLRAHVVNGFNVLTAEGPRSITAAPGESLQGVRKTLAGDPKRVESRPPTLVTFAPLGAAETNGLELLDAADPSLLVVRHWTSGSQASFALVTDYEKQSQAATAALEEAVRIVHSRPGEGIEKLREVKVLYPFNDHVRNEATRVAQEEERRARAEIAEYRDALEAFNIFRSVDTLARLDEVGARLGDRYASRGAADGPLESSVAEIRAQAAEARTAWYAEHAGAELTRLERLADLLADVEGYQPMAAIFYRTIVERFGDLEGDDSFGRRVTRARAKYEQLIEDPAVKEALPVLPKEDEDD